MSSSLRIRRDNRLVLRSYAWLVGIGGVVTTFFGWMWFKPDLPGLPWGMESLVRVVGTSMIASGCWAATLSQMNDPDLRRKNLRWFAAAHVVVLLILQSQCVAIWPALVTSKLQPAIALQFFAVLFLLLHSESYFVDRDTGLPVMPGGEVDVRTLYERQIRQAGAQEERNRLARDLHDSIKQQIFVIRTAAATAQTRFETDRAGAALALDQVRESARDAMTEMEVLIDQLRAVPLENSTLVAALKKQCEALGHRTGAAVDFTVGALPVNEALAPGSHQTILRVAQEACANIGRHARAKNVTVSLASRGKILELRIQDDGVGFEPSRGHAGLGLANMRARAKERGGEFHLSSSPGKGVTLVFSLPSGTQLLPSHRREYVQQGLVFVATFAGVMIFVPSQWDRTFVLWAWGFAGVTRVIQWTLAHRRELAARSSE
jgi:signal transduction histidine kinase